MRVGEGGESSNPGGAHGLREMPYRKKSCAPVAVAPEGRGCEGANEAPSRTSDVDAQHAAHSSRSRPNRSKTPRTPIDIWDELVELL